MRLRKLALAAVVALLGGAVAAIPALAGSEPQAAIEAINTAGANPHAWSPASVTVTADGVVEFSNPSAQIPHGVRWTGGPATPVCDAGVPVESSGTAWNGRCTFAQAGTYTFRCTVHAYMTGTITVGSGGATTTTTTTGPPTTGTSTTPVTTGTSTTTTTSATAGGSAPGANATRPPGGQTPPARPDGGSEAADLLVGSASSAWKLHAIDHGRAIGGSLAVAPAGAGGHLTVQLLAPRVLLARAAGAPVMVGELQRSHLRAGVLVFTVALDARARRVLRARGLLRLSVRLVLSPRQGAPLRLLRGVAVRG